MEAMSFNGWRTLNDTINHLAHVPRRSPCDLADVRDAGSSINGNRCVIGPSKDRECGARPDSGRLQCIRRVDHCSRETSPRSRTSVRGERAMQTLRLRHPRQRRSMPRVWQTDCRGKQGQDAPATSYPTASSFAY
jgi:hypothetical protein